jgi:hypothetical protein
VGTGTQDQPPAAGTGATPWTIDLDANLLVGASVGTLTPTPDGQCFYGGYVQSGGTQNERADWPVLLGAGTWSLALMVVQSPSGGIVTVQLDDGAGSFSTIGTVDLYNAGVVRNLVHTFTGVAVAATGVKTLRLLMATKNASASNFYLFAQHVALVRTA